jgi:hypothetical protein
MRFFKRSDWIIGYWLKQKKIHSIPSEVRIRNKKETVCMCDSWMLTNIILKLEIGHYLLITRTLYLPEE